MSQIPLGRGQRSRPLTNQEHDQMMLHHFGGTKQVATIDLLGFWIFIAVMMAITATPLICGVIYMISSDWLVDNLKIVATGAWLISTIFAIAQDTQNGDTQLHIDVIRRV